MKTSIFLILILLLIIKNDCIIKENYSINVFIDYLLKNGYYEIISEIYCKFGENIAIDFC